MQSQMSLWFYLSRDDAKWLLNQLREELLETDKFVSSFFFLLFTKWPMNMHELYTAW